MGYVSPGALDKLELLCKSLPYAIIDWCKEHPNDAYIHEGKIGIWGVPGKYKSWDGPYGLTINIGRTGDKVCNLFFRHLNDSIDDMESDIIKKVKLETKAVKFINRNKDRLNDEELAQIVVGIGFKNEVQSAIKYVASVKEGLKYGLFDKILDDEDDDDIVPVYSVPNQKNSNSAKSGYSPVEEMDILCPVCNKPVSVKKYKSINVSTNPELKAKVLDGSLFKLHCTHCGLSAPATSEVLYHDPTKKFIIQLLQGERAYNVPEEIDNFYKNVSLPGYRYRIVNNLRELREKIRIFDLNLNDYAVELLKGIAISQLGEKVDPDDIDSLEFITIAKGEYFFEAHKNQREGNENSKFYKYSSLYEKDYKRAVNLVNLSGIADDDNRRLKYVEWVNIAEEFASLVESKGLSASDTECNGDDDEPDYSTKASSGKFGYELTNPIHCTSVPEEYVYLRRLVSEKGSIVNMSRVGSFKNEIGICDGWDINVKNGWLGPVRKIRLYVFPYADEISEEAPDGFHLK